MNWIRFGKFTEMFAFMFLWAIIIPVWVGILLAVVLILAPLSPRVAAMVGLMMSTLLLIFTIAGPFYIISRIKKRREVR